MPRLSGKETVRLLRGKYSEELPGTAVTANAFVDDVRNAIESGMDAYIAKPVRIDNLKPTIRQVLNSPLEQSEKDK